jgi:prevent-host-death family protein
MAIQTTYTHARANLATLCDEVTANREVVIIHRRGAEDVALISAADLASLMETAHLLGPPRTRNACSPHWHVPSAAEAHPNQLRNCAAR